MGSADSALLPAFSIALQGRVKVAKSAGDTMWNLNCVKLDQWKVWLSYFKVGHVLDVLKMSGYHRAFMMPDRPHLSAGSSVPEDRTDRNVACNVQSIASPLIYPAISHRRRTVPKRWTHMPSVQTPPPAQLE